MNKYIEYLRDNPKKYWFKRKLFGWGWTPATWQGWFVILIYVVLVLSLSLTFDPNSSLQDILLYFCVPFVLFTICLIKILHLKGEKPKWMWGLPKK